MSEINNLSDIKENFDTIKSLLNSIRAQDVLNNGDINKLLATMNGKLDKLNQEENIELMNSVLSTIKQTLDERHSVLVSKFSTIESLFSNILKNSVDSLKSSEIKELFDIIATNLSVFSREVVSQKDTLTDIILRIESMRTDDGHSALVVSNIEALKRDLERFNNGFESIIVNLNDNFGSIVRTLDDIREKSADNHYDKDFENLYMTSNSLLSSVQALDKKSVQFEETLASILAKCDNKLAEDRLSELFLQNKEIFNSIGELAVNCNVEPLYQKIDNASALIGSLREVLSNVDSDATSEYISRLAKMETAINRVLDENDFRKLRTDLESALNQIANSVNISQNDLYVVKNDIETIASSIKALDIHVNFQNIQSTLTKSEVNIKTYISDLSNKFSQLSDLTFQRTVDDIKQKVDALGAEIKTTAGENLEALSGSLIGLKSSINEIESTTNDSNAQLFKSVSERLGVLENTLAGLLNSQLVSITGTGKQMAELAGAVNLKLDTAQVEFASAREGVDELKSKIESIVNIDFEALLADVKNGLAASQAEYAAALKDSVALSDMTLAEGLNAKFESAQLQVDECNKNLTLIYKDGLSELRSLLNGITSTLIDIVSYVSVSDKKEEVEFEKRFTDIEYAVKDYSLDSIEKINTFIKENVEKINTKLTNYDATTQSHFQNLASKIENNSLYIREDIKSAYQALEVLKTDIQEFKEYVIADINNNPVKAEVVDRIAGLKSFLTDRLSDFEQTFVRDGMEKFGELEELNARIINKIETLSNDNRTMLTDVRNELVNGVKESLDNCVDRAIEDIRSFVEVSTNTKNIELETLKTDCNNILSDLKEQVPNLVEEINVDGKLDEFKQVISNVISKTLERNQQTQGEIAEKLEVFGNTLYKLVGNGGITVNQAFEKIDELGKVVVAKAADVSELNSMVSEISDTLALIQVQAGKSSVQEEIINEVLSIRSQLGEQGSEVERLYDLCSQIANGGGAKEISDALSDFKAEVVAQVTAIFNQISFAAEQEEIVGAIKLQQDEFRESVRKLAATIDEGSTSYEKISSAIADLGLGLEFLKETTVNVDKAEEIVGGLKVRQEELKEALSKLMGSVDAELASYEKVSAEISKVRLSVEHLKETAVSADKAEEIALSLTNLSNTVNELRSELPTKAVEHLQTQVDKLIEGVKLNDAIATNIIAIKDKLEIIDKERIDFRENVEGFISKAVAKLDTISDAKGLKDYITTGFDELYNNIAAKIDIFGSNTELVGLLSAVMAKQDGNLAKLIDKIDSINNEDVIDGLDVIKRDITTQVLNIFNQISFEAEAIEIKSEISDAKDELNAAITQVSDGISKILAKQNEFVDDYTSSLQRFEETLENNHVFQLKAISEVAVSNKELAESIENNHIAEVKAISEVTESTNSLAATLEDIILQIKSIQESGGEDSHYSLSDIESDLTKLRLVLSDIKENLNKREFESVISSIDVVITQIQDLKAFIPVDKIDEINENSIDVLDLLEGLALEIKGLHSTQEDILGAVHVNAEEIQSEFKTSLDGFANEIRDLQAAQDDVIGAVKVNAEEIQSDFKMSLEDFANEIKEFSKDTLSAKLASVKNEIFTQLLSVINQISFVEEQEEIISHIDDVQARLNLISSGSEDEMGNYSLLDIETDVAKLRVALEEIKAEGRGAEVDGLVEALAKASDTLEYLKTEIPNHEISEVRAELEKIANDIISISIRTNKLLISSDESYKDLKEHIETFHSIIGDVDERTKNLYEEVGMDKLEYQVTSIRDIVGRQELTNQVFNEVFEYLAEWIDSTGEKISYITEKLNNKEDINEIKLSLEELRKATSVKFEIDAQSEKINAMETKLNVIIESLEPTFQHQQERMQALERKVNRIVDFFEPAFTTQQERINKLESLLDKILDVVSSDNGYGDALTRLNEISEIVTAKDDSQLVKKLSSFERQISKLNKSVEKLTTYANEK